MAFNKNGILFSVACDELIYELKSDRMEFGYGMVDFAYYMQDGIAIPLTYKPIDCEWDKHELDTNLGKVETVKINVNVLIDYMKKLHNVIESYDYIEFEDCFK